MRRTWWLARPWFLVSVAVLVVNDQVLKAAASSWLTGKVSDVAGRYRLVKVLG